MYWTKAFLLSEKFLIHNMSGRQIALAVRDGPSGSPIRLPRIVITSRVMDSGICELDFTVRDVCELRTI